MKVGAVKQSSRDNSEEEMIKENKQVAVAVSHVQKSAFGVTHNFLLILENNGLQTELKISGLCKSLVSIYLQLFLIFSKPDRYTSLLFLTFAQLAANMIFLELVNMI